MDTAIKTLWRTRIESRVKQREAQSIGGLLFVFTSKIIKEDV